MTTPSTTTALSSPLELYIARRLRERPLLLDAHEDALTRQRQEFTLEYEDKRRRGWVPRELVSGELDRGCTDGDPVFRPPASTVTAAIRQRAEEALQALSATFGSRAEYAIDGIQFGKLEAGAWGSWAGTPWEIEVCIEQAEVAVRQAERQQAAVRQARAASPILVVVETFEGKGRKPYAPGTYEITNAERQALEAWRDEMLAQAHRPCRHRIEDWRSCPRRPVGFPEGRVFPPFTIAEPARDLDALTPSLRPGGRTASPAGSEASPWG